ncbi:MAG: class I SAM-dependent methyltransferase [Alphaproteobacteria bacterium]|nr:class I SAM-dependent methyltransferase [Alphaproteobacteria bacterium]
MSKRTQISGPLDVYADANWLRDTDVKRWLREETARLPGGMMQVSADQGQLLGLLARAIGARLAVEVGTFTGYSALCVAEALPPTGKLHACDVSEEWTRIGRRYWNEAGVADRIELHIGPALASLDELIDGGLAGHVDMAFIDANKTDYDAYYERCLTLLRPRGLMLIDNVLWGGAVADPDDHTADTMALRALNAKLHDDQRIDLGLLPVGDGMTMALKR